MDWLQLLLEEPPVAPECSGVAAWWDRHLARAREVPSTLGQAIAGGFAADRIAWAFASAYRAALQSLVPSLPADELAALCVTEAGGNAPRAIQTELRPAGGGRFVLNGAKRWTTLGPGAQSFLVACREAASTDERPQLRMVRIELGSPGLAVLPMPPVAFVPELAHAQLRFDDVPVDAGAVLPGDGYERYVKPFRTVEDVHVHAAALAYLVREARRLAWPQAWVERAVAGLFALEVIAGRDPLASATHIALAGTLAEAHRLFVEADTHWQASAEDAEAVRWRRDRALLAVASAARVQRTARAWERIGRLPGTAT